MKQKTATQQNIAMERIYHRMEINCPHQSREPKIHSKKKIGNLAQSKKPRKKQKLKPSPRLSGYLPKHKPCDSQPKKLDAPKLKKINDSTIHQANIKKIAQRQPIFNWRRGA